MASRQPPILLMLSLALLTGCGQQADVAPAEETQPMLMNQTHHTIDYIEFRITDMRRAQDFYSAAFGWEFTDYGPDYAGIHKPGGEGEVGGLHVADQVTRGGPLVILYSDDLEATLRRVKDAGGEIVEEPFEFPGGRRFHFLDPAGNELAVWSPR